MYLHEIPIRIHQICTLPETNIAPKNSWFPIGISKLPGGVFLGAMFVSGRVGYTVRWIRIPWDGASWLKVKISPSEAQDGGRLGTLLHIVESYIYMLCIVKTHEIDFFRFQYIDICRLYVVYSIFLYNITWWVLIPDSGLRPSCTIVPTAPVAGSSLNLAGGSVTDSRFCFIDS